MSANQSFEQLETYIREQMRMSHVYQPVMLQVLLEKGGSALTEDVAKALLGYAIWRDSELIYCGMSGREIDVKGKAAPKKYGLITRLNSHASGRLSGDQFCVYVANRFVIPSLRAEDLPLFASGSLSLAARTRTFIHDHLDYAYALVQTSADAYELERAARRGDVFGVQPYLNPL